MPNSSFPEIIDVTLDNVDKTGFFCFMSKKKAPGYAKKLNWLKERMTEGLRIKMLKLPERGFIEYIPGEYAFRAVNADGFMFIHCLWVVGKSKGKGSGKLLLDTCIEDARNAGMKGVATLCSDGNWLHGSEIFKKNGFECVSEEFPFSLWVMKFKPCENPAFCGQWKKKTGYPEGLTIYTSDQCPYVHDAELVAIQTAEKVGFPVRTVKLKTRDDIVNLSPTPYGSFALVLNGKLLGYHYLLEKDLLPVLNNC